MRAWHTPGRQHGQRSATNLAKAATNQNPIMQAVMRLSPTTPVADDGDPAANRALSRQPLGIIPTGLASIAGTWDKDDHGCEGMPRNRYPPRHMTPRCRLRS